MSTRKFDFEPIYFTNELVSELVDEGVLQKNNILPEQLRYIILQLAQNNYELDGRLSLSKDQMLKAMEQAHKLSTEFVINQMVNEGLVEYDGVTPDGNYTIKFTKKGEEVGQETTEGKVMQIIKDLQNQNDISENAGC
jgi:hypothetical protein